MARWRQMLTGTGDPTMGSPLAPDTATLRTLKAPRRAAVTAP